jgi:hypothetical protein
MELTAPRTAEEALEAAQDLLRQEGQRLTPCKRPLPVKHNE